MSTIDPTGLDLGELRRIREELQREDDAVSYARRVAQARLDLVRTERARRSSTPLDEVHVAHVVQEDLAEVLSQHLTGGDARPPRPTEDLSDAPVAIELEETCASYGFGRLDQLDDAGLDRLEDALNGFERRISSDRRERFARIDALTAELVRRYRDGEADVDSLFAD